MRSSALQRFALCFTILLLTQEFCVARYRPNSLKRNGIKRSNSNAVVTNEKGLQRERRSIGAVLIGTAIFVSLANVALDVYLQVEGCCGIYSDACIYHQEFIDSKNEMEATNKIINEKWLHSENVYTYLSPTNNLNEEIWLELKRITNLYEQIVQVLSPDIIGHYVNKTDEIRKQVAAHNTTVINWSESDLSTEFQSLFDTSLGTIQHLSGVVGVTAQTALGSAVNWYKTRSITNMIRTDFGHQLTNVRNAKAFKVLGADDFDAFTRETGVARRNAEVAASRGSKILGIAGNVLVVIQIGFEIFMAILKIKQCEQTRDEMKKARDLIIPDLQTIRDLKVTVDSHYANLTSEYALVRNQLVDEQFQDYLTQIQDLAAKASTQTPSLQTAATDIGNFNSYIGEASKSDAIKLQKTLIWALGNVTFTLSCVELQVRTYQLIAKGCSDGDGTIDSLFTSVTQSLNTNSGTCETDANIPYTSKANSIKYVSVDAAANGYDTDCTVNSQTKLDQVCSDKCDGYTNEQIETKRSLTASQVQKFVTKCGKCPLSPVEKTQICLFKGAPYNFSLDQVKTFMGNADEGLVTDQYENGCP